MTTFHNYSRYYDLLYGNKDYTAESQYIHELFSRHSKQQIRAILELGSGTGRHAQLLAKKGYLVHGIDMSNDMLNEAEKRKLLLPNDISERISFSQGDIRKIELDNTFDAVLSLFHVMSYQTTNDDLLAAFSTAHAHLKQDGIFIFDCWYGPAVLTDRPCVRVKRLEDDSVEVTRIAEPVLHPDRNLVDVNYHVYIKDKTSGSVQELKETHVMRYLFSPEVHYFLERSGFQFVCAEEWLTGNSPGFDTWGVCFIGRRA